MAINKQKVIFSSEQGNIGVPLYPTQKTVINFKKKYFYFQCIQHERHSPHVH